MRLLVIAVLLCSAIACAAPEVDQEQSAPARETERSEPTVRPDINAPYLSQDLDVDDLAEGFSSESREVFVAREAVADALSIEAGDVVADVGAGTGIYLRPFSTRVGADGTVYAVDISELLVTYIERFSRQEGLDNVEALLGDTADTGLGAGTVDLVFTSDVYHHFERPSEMNAHLYEVIKPGGRYAVLDFRRGPNAPDWIQRHVRGDMATVVEEVTAAGFEFEGEVSVPGLRDNYLIVFRRPA